MATQQLTTYEFDQVFAIVGGILCDGFQDGEGISISNTADTFTAVVGADGRVTRSKTLNRTAMIEISLMASSATNDLLSALHTLDSRSQNGAGIVPISIIDKSGRSVFTAPQAWLIKPPDVSLDRESTPRVWRVFVANLDRFDGGN